MSLRKVYDRGNSAPVDSGGEPPDDENMEARVAKLEGDLSAIKIDVAVIKANGATKSDVSELGAKLQNGFTEMIKWVVGTAVVLGSAAIVIMTFVLNNAVPKTPASPVQSTPIVIAVPGTVSSTAQQLPQPGLQPAPGHPPSK